MLYASKRVVSSSEDTETDTETERITNQALKRVRDGFSVYLKVPIYTL